MHPPRQSQSGPRSLNAAYARLLLAYLLQLQPELARQLTPEQLSHLDERDPAARCSLQAWHGLMDLAELHLGRRDLVPELAEQFKPWHAGLVGFTLMTCPTVNKLAGLLKRYQALLNDVFVVEPGLSGDRFFLKLREASAERSPRLVRLLLCIWAERLRWLTARPDLKLDASFEGPAPTDIGPYRRIFGGTVKFEQDENAMWGEAAHASLPIVSHDPASHTLLQTQASLQLERIATGDERLIDALQGLVRSRLDDGKLSLEDAAAALRLPARTLQRRLEESGQNFRQIVEDVRRATAEQYLRGTQMPLAELASALGFADHASFNRAFKRWTGSSPGAYRRASNQAQAEAASSNA